MTDREQLPGNFDIAADLDTPVSAYLKLQPLRPRYLLESVEGGTRLARYSFLGFGAATEVTIGRDSVRIGTDERPLPNDIDGLKALLREALATTPALAPAIDDLPFDGGLVGYAAYDIVRYFERLAAPRPSEHGIVAAYAGCESVLVFDHLTRRMALLHAGSDVERRQLKQRVIDLLRGPLPAQSSESNPTPPSASLDQATFEDLVRRCQKYIRAGDIYQIVLSVRFAGAGRPPPFDVYRALRLLNPSPYMFYLDIGGLQVAGSSPEALVRCSDRQASLRPIAGTRPRGETADVDRQLEQELLADPKECAEHVMLVDLARNDLGRVAEVGTVHVDPYMTIERYSHVMHIVSGVSGTLATDADAFDLFAAAFPAGTLVGAPKVRAMQIIDELEPVNRELYAGTVGYFGKSGDMDQAITIRTLVFDGDNYSFQAGAGIVADSDPTAEYHEVLHKSAILRSALAIAAEGL
ncbi:MAG: chorismate-binding protein [Pseudomonadota bacterium]